MTNSEIAASNELVTDWRDIRLTHDEATKALDQVRIDKYSDVRNRRIMKEVAEASRLAREPWTSKQLFQHMEYLAATRYGLKRINPENGEEEFGLQTDEFNLPFLQAMCYYFTGNKQAFEKMGKNEDQFGPQGKHWDIDKGLFVFGGVGAGKTTSMRLLTKNKRACFDIIKARTIADAFKESGVSIIKSFSHLRQEPASIDFFFQQKIGLLIEDLGTEDPESSNYGNKKNVLAEILMNRYDHYQNGVYGRQFTHITSNLTPEEVEDSYGIRVRDRFREQFNIVVLTGPSRRK